MLASVDKTGRRKWIHLHLMGGAWRRRRALFSALLIGFYLALPFLEVGGRPFLRFDIPQRQFWIAGHAFIPQDLTYFVVFVLIGIVGTLLAVALLGRIFCGWFCPHNVFLEQVFRPIERLFQGPAHRRARIAREGGDPLAWAAKLGTWAAYAVVAGALANTATALFVGTAGFRWGLIVDPALHPEAAVFFAIFFAIILFNFGWFREQTCTIVCPYGRFQAVLLDPHSLVVAYDPRRGEPRGKPGAAAGDCVDCKLCVAVCPTGIDIRNGNQLECIHCTACIDACDQVMGRLGRAPDLIGYRSEAELAGTPRRMLRPRVLLYAGVLALLVGFLGWRLATRAPVVVNVLRTTAAPTLDRAGDGREIVRQVMPLALISRSGSPLAVRVVLPELPEARVLMQDASVVLPPAEHISTTALVEIPRAAIGPVPRWTPVAIVDAAGAVQGRTMLRIAPP